MPAITFDRDTLNKWARYTESTQLELAAAESKGITETARKKAKSDLKHYALDASVQDAWAIEAIGFALARKRKVYSRELASVAARFRNMSAEL